MNARSTPASTPQRAVRTYPGPIVTLGALVGHSLRAQRRSVPIWGLALGVLSALTVGLYPSVGASVEDLLVSYPPELKALFGFTDVASVSTIEGWLAMEVFNLMAPLALAIYPILLGARALAGAEERGTLDLLLSNPLPRWQLVLSAFLTMALALLGILSILGLLIWGAAVLVAVALPLATATAAVLNLWPLCLFFGGLALLCSSLVHRGGVAIAVPGGVLVAMYMANALSGIAESLRPLRAASVFYHYGSAVEHGIDWPSFAAITTLAMLLTGLAALAFERRNIYT